jgi:hypothetical protein
MAFSFIVESLSFSQTRLGTARDSSADVPSRATQNETAAPRAIESRKRRVEQSLSPTSRKIRVLQQELEILMDSRRTKE